MPNSTGVQTGGTANCNIIPAAMVNPVGRAVLQPLSRPQREQSLFGLSTTLDVPDRKLNEGTWDIRLDHNFSSKDSVFARFSYDQATNFVPGGSPGFAEATAFGSTQYIENHGRNLAVSETHIVSPNTINQFNAGFSRIFNHILSFGTGTCEAAIIGIPGADLGSKCDSLTGYPASLNQATNDCEGCGMTSFSMSSYYSVGDRGYAPYQGGSNVYSVSDTLDLIRGKHEIRFGGVFRDNQMNVRNNAFQDGFVSEIGNQTGDDIADTLIGGMGNFAAHDQTFDGATVGRRWKLVRPFVQDDWRVSNNLTVNLGLAWAVVTPETEVENRQSNFDFLDWHVVRSEGSSGDRRLPQLALLPTGAWGSIWTKPHWSRASGWPGSPWGARTPQSVPGTRSSTTPRGTRADRDCGKTRHTMRKWIPTSFLASLIMSPPIP